MLARIRGMFEAERSKICHTRIETGCAWVFYTQALLLEKYVGSVVREVELFLIIIVASPDFSSCQQDPNLSVKVFFKYVCLMYHSLTNFVTFYSESVRVVIKISRRAMRLSRIISASKPLLQRGNASRVTVLSQIGTITGHHIPPSRTGNSGSRWC